MPGSLSATTEGPGCPVYVLVTLAHGKPFETQDPYMFLLDLKLALIALKFVDHDFLFLTHPLGTSENEMVRAFNESEALSSGWLPDVRAAPEMFHEAVSSLMIADALHAVLVSFEPRLQAVRAELGKLDLDNTAGSQVVQLRNRLLGISREVSIVCSDVSVLLADAAVIWRDLLPLTWLGPGGGTPVPADATAETKKFDRQDAGSKANDARLGHLRSRTCFRTNRLPSSRSAGRQRLTSGAPTVHLVLTCGAPGCGV